MQDISQHSPTTGISRDTSYEFQTEGTYLYALNAIKGIDNVESLQNEPSNIECISIPSGLSIIGSIFVNNKFVIFSTNDITSEMGIFDPDTCAYDKLPINCDLGFKRTHMVRGVSKILDYCSERMIYWTDGLNPYRYLNIDRPTEVTECADLNLFSCSGDLTTAEVKVADGGGLMSTGLYQVALRYATRTGTSSKLAFISQLIPIYDEGSFVPWRYRDGAPAGTLTTKSIVINSDSIDDNADFVQVILIKYQNFNVSAALVDELEVTGTTLQYVVTDIGGNPIPMSELIVKEAFYSVGNLITTHNNKLLLGDVVQTRNINYQKYANQIEVTWKTIKLPLTSTYKDNYDFKTFMGDEVYALGIVWKFCDGSTSPAFHIPGPTEVPCFEPINSKLLISAGDIEEESTYQDITYTSIHDIVPENDINNFFDCEKEVWEIFNTAGICESPHEETITEYDDCGQLISSEIGTWEKGHLAYYEQSGRYPASLDCDGNYIYPHTVLDECNEDYQFNWGFIKGSDSTLASVFGLDVIPGIVPETIQLTVTINGTTVVSQNNLNAFTLNQSGIDTYGANIDVHITTQYLTLTCQFTITAATDNSWNYYTDMTCDGIGVLMDKIRHHRMPDRRLVPHFTSVCKHPDCIPNGSSLNDRGPDGTWDDVSIYPIAIEVNNVTPPDDAPLEVIGYDIVHVRRTDSNKTVVAKGLIHNTTVQNFSEGIGVLPNYVVNGADRTPGISAYSSEGQDDYYLSKQVKMHSPNTDFDNTRLVLGNYLKVERVYRGIVQTYNCFEDFSELEDSAGIRMCAVRHWAGLCTHYKHPYNYNYKILGSTYLPAHSIVTGNSTLPYINLHQESGVGIELNRRPTWQLEYDEQFDWDGNLSFLSCLGSFATPNLFSQMIVDSSLTSCIFPGGASEDDCRNGGCAQGYYATIKRLTEYPVVSALVYHRLGSTIKDNTYFGDAFINYWAYRRTAFLRYHSSGGWMGWMGSENACFNEHDPQSTLLESIYESDVNVNMRYEGTAGLGEVYYPKLAGGAWLLTAYKDNNVADITYLTHWRREYDSHNLINMGTDNYNKYNFDYSNVDLTQAFVGIPIDYKSCDCDVRLTNTIVASEEDSGTVDIDGWRIFKANNYIDIPRITGRLMNLFSLNNSLYAHTENNIWRLNTSETQLQASESTIYLGSSELITAKPQYLYMTDEGFAGTQQRNGYLKNIGGYYFIDSYAGKVFNLADEIKILDKGLKRWITDNTKFKLLEQVSDYPFTDNTVIGIGWHFGYDNEYNRVLITKIDYEFIDPSTYQGHLNEAICEVGKVYLHPDGRFVLIVDTDCSYSFIDFTNTDIFCNVSWTLSYSYLSDSYVSWHSYLPYKYFSTRKDFFSAIGNKIYKHNVEHDYQVFYGIYRPFDLELSIKSGAVNITDNILYYQDAYIYDTTYKRELSKDITFTHGFLYNSTQNTGWFTFVKKDDFDETNMQLSIKDQISEVKVNRIEKSWYYNEIADNVIDNTIPHTAVVCGDNPADLTPNDVAIDQAKPYYIRMPFRDNYVVQRLRLNNIQFRNTRINVKTFAEVNTKSVR